MNESLFIGYRREDTADAAGRVYDRLVAAFGREQVFKDVDALPIGQDFGRHITDVLSKCRVFLALIGPNWLSAHDNLGRRLDNPNDWVRLEIETALAARNVQVIPVLMNGAQMPSPNDLPTSLHPLLNLNAAIIRRDPDFHTDMDRLIAALEAGELSGFVRVPGESQAATGIWQRISSTDDARELERFITTFEGTPEAFSARRRLHHLQQQAAERQKKNRARGRRLWAAIAAAIAVIAGAILFLFAQANVDYLDRGLQQSPIFVRMKQEHSAAYSRMLWTTVPLSMSGADDDRLVGSVYDSMTGFWYQNTPIMMQAEPGELVNYANRFLDVLQALAGQDENACAAQVEGRALPPSVHEQVDPQLTALALAQLNLIDSGRRAGRQYQPLSEEDLQWLRSATQDQGATASIAAAIGTPRLLGAIQLLNPAEKCEFGIALYRAIISPADAPQTARYVVGSFRGDLLN